MRLYSDDLTDHRYDVRAESGYVIAAGTHPSGARYTPQGDWTQPRAALPVFDLDWLFTRRAYARPAQRAVRHASPDILLVPAPMWPRCRYR